VLSHNADKKSAGRREWWGGMGRLPDSIDPSKFMKKILLILALCRLVEILWCFGGTYNFKFRVEN